MPKAILKPLKPKPYPEYVHHSHLFDLGDDIVWTTLAPLPKPLCNCSAFVINRKILGCGRVVQGRKFLLQEHRL